MLYYVSITSPHAGKGANDYLLDEELHDKYPTCYQDGKTVAIDLDK